MRPRYLELAILLLSVAGIAYQIALMRVLSIGQFHHFAYMIISIAMLGFGASGTLLALMRERVAGQEVVWLKRSALLTGPSLVLCYDITQQVPFETFQLTSQPGHWRYLLLLYIVLAVPFFFMACCVALAFMLLPREVPRLYFYDLAGSGVGAFGVIAMLYLVPPHVVPYLLGLVCLLAWALLLVESRTRAAALGALCLIAAAAIVPLRDALPLTPPRVSEYKGLSYALQFPDADVMPAYTSPISVLTPVRSSMIRETPGQLSLRYPMSELGQLPPQIGLFFDAGAVSPVHEYTGFPDTFAWMAHVTAAAAFEWVEAPRTVVIGAGGGTDVLMALYHGARQVDALEVEPNVFRFSARYAPDLYERPDVRPIVAEGRGYLQAAREPYDLIVLPLMGSYTAASAGVFALHETNLYTVEALQLYAERLAPGGVLMMNCWLKTPPRDAIKLFATAVEAAEQAGIDEPGQHLAMLRTWNNATILYSPEPLDDARITRLRAFAESRGFDLDYFPGIREIDANRFMQMEEPIYFDAAQAILFGDREAFYRNYLFFVRPATDDRPYFFRSFKWRSLPRLLEGMGTEWVPFVELGYVTLVVTLGQGVIVAAVLILLPLVVLARRVQARRAKGAVIAYFAALGIGFMLIEIAFIQLFMRFLTYPVYAVSVVLTAFLLASGIGSLVAGQSRLNEYRLMVFAIAGIAVTACVYLAVLPPLFQLGAAWPDIVKVPASILLLAPLAFWMGMPFPIGLRRASAIDPNLLPWAWGINGCTSVIGASLATLLAIHLGFTAVIVIAVMIYLTALLSFWRLADVEK